MWWETVKHGSVRREGEIPSTYSTPQIVEEMKQNATPESLSQENIELKKRLAAMEQELHEAKMAAAAYNKMIDIAERLYKIPVRKKSGPKQ